MKQIDVLNSIIPKLKSNPNTTAILLMGSVASKTALPTSDLDLMILGDECKFQTEIIDGIQVEYLYLTYDEAVHKMNIDEMDIYHYIGSKIMYDIDGRMIYLMRMAFGKFKNYKTPPHIKVALKSSLMGIKMKLTAYNDNSDTVNTDFITAINSWKALEGIWAINNKPMPPSGRVLVDLKELEILPGEHWFEELFSRDTKKRTDKLLSLIDWILPQL